MTSIENHSAEEIPSTWPVTERLALQLLDRQVLDRHQNDVQLKTDTGGSSNAHLLISTLSRGQAAAEITSRSNDLTSSNQVLAAVLFEFEHYRFRVLCDSLGASNSLDAIAQAEPEPFTAIVSDRLRIVCAAEPDKAIKYPLAVLCVRRDWGAELTRDLLQMFFDRVSDDGHLIVVVDHPDDSWVGEHLRDAAKPSSLPISKIVRRFTLADETSGQAATGYVVAAEAMNMRRRNFSCQFAFRHNGKLLQAVSYPGVFAHRKLDLGARRLMDAMEIGEQDKVLDIGCGSGVVSFAVAATSPTVSVTAIDSNMRAIECARIGTGLNQLDSQIKVIASSDGTVPDTGMFDVALGNPPYFANFHIAELFLQAAHDAVRPGGKIWFVAKQPDWYKLHVPRWFDRVKVQSVGGGYCIASGIRPQQSREAES